MHLILAIAAIAVAASASTQHVSHRLAPLPLDVLRRPVPVRAGIGRVHHESGSARTQAQALYEQGLAYLHSYVWIEAARSFNSALAHDSKLALAHVGLSVAYVELNRPADARTALDAARALLASSTDHVRRHVEARTLQMAAEDAPADAAKLAAYRQSLDAAVAAFPTDVELLLLRGMAESSDPAERGQGSGLAAVKHYQRALAAAPQSFAPHHYLTHAFENSGRLEEALAHSASYAKLAPEVPHARHMHGHNLRRAGRVYEAIAQFEAADRLHREYTKREQVPLEHDWHFEHNLGLLGTSLQYVGQMKRAEASLQAAFRLPTGLLVQAFNKREWPMFLRARGRLQEAEAAAKVLIANPHPVVQATGYIEAGFVALAANRYADAGAASNAALKLLRSAPGGAVAANALLALQGEFHLRTAARDKGRATLYDVVKRVRAAPGPDSWVQALFTLEAIARAARAVGDWDLARGITQQMIEHDAAYPGAQYAAGLLAEHEGNAAAARVAFERALSGWSKADPDLEEVRQIKSRLAKLPRGN